MRCPIQQKGLVNTVNSGALLVAADSTGVACGGQAHLRSEDQFHKPR